MRQLAEAVLEGTLRSPGAGSTAPVTVAGTVARGTAVRAASPTVLVRHLGRLGGVGVAQCNFRIPE